MADSAESFRAMEVFWSRDESDVEDALVYVPGVKDPGNRRPTKIIRIKGGKTQELKPSIPVGRQRVAEVVQKPGRAGKNPTKKANGKDEMDDGHKRHQRKASLKDLCSEDKRRVANLINELARVGDEKEKVAQELTSERQNFEKEIQNVMQQQEKVLRERQAVQQQLWECQNLLGRYQKMMSSQQDTLNQCFSEDRENQQLPPEDSRQHSGRQQLAKNPASRQHKKQNDEQQKFVASSKQNTNVNLPSDKATNTSVGLHNKRSHDKHTLNNTPQKHSQGVPSLSLDPQKHSQGVPSLSLDPQKHSQGVPSLNVDSQIGDSSEFELTPRGTRRVRVPSVGSEHRPFTALIDSLIAEEKYSLPPPSSCPSSPENPPGGARTGRSLQGAGPLHPPVLSSTQHSDVLSVSHQSRTKAGEFEPLPLDPSPASSLQSAGVMQERSSQHFSNQALSQSEQTQYLGFPQSTGPDIPGHYPAGPHPGQSVAPQNPLEPQGTKVTFNEHHAPPPSQPHHPPHELSNEDFVNYYKSMTPEQRQRHLLTQKAALLSEQQRLRQILQHQEDLLRAKQSQLHLQQDLQRQRLQFFEQTGNFPSSRPESFSSECHPLDQDKPEVDLTLRDGPRPPVHSREEVVRLAMVSNLTLQDGPRPPVHSQEEALRLAMVTNNPMDPQEPQIPQPSMTQPSVDKRPHPNGLVQGALPYPKYHQGQPVNASHDEAEVVTDSFENFRFLEKHGIDVGPKRATAKKYVHGPTEEDLDRQEVEAMAALLNKPQQRPQKVQSHGTRRQPMNGPRSAQPPSRHRLPDSKRGSQLVDLVDEVEGVQGRSWGSDPHHSNHLQYQETTLEDAGPQDTGDDEDAEESRILEEVFFLR